MNEYVWGLYLKSGGSDTVEFFKKNFADKITADYASVIKNFKEVYCIDSYLIEETEQALQAIINSIDYSDFDEYEPSDMTEYENFINDELSAEWDFVRKEVSSDKEAFEDLEGCGNSVYVDRNMTLFAGYHTIVLKSKNGSDNKYLAYQMNTDSWRNQIRCKVFGVKLFSITKKILNDVTYIVPSISEKEEIVEYLDEKCSIIDRIIEKKSKTLEELELLKKTLIYEYVTGKKEVPQND